MQVGDEYTSHLTIGHLHLARTLGSGDLLVLATPAMLALMENAAMQCVAPTLPPGSTTVGGHIESSHLRPTPMGRTISATATLREIKGRKLTFDVEAYDGEILIGRGTHLRFIVDRDAFVQDL
ncbi:MAG: thioesterase family protein [Bacteroidaceae bacterium]|nr:thioesterase family protein [Bacteroidaceae bacterium]